MPRAFDGSTITIAPAMYNAIADAMSGNANAIMSALTTQTDTAKLRITRNYYTPVTNVDNTYDKHANLTCKNASVGNNFLDLMFNFSNLADASEDCGKIEYSPDGTNWTPLFYINSGFYKIDTTSSYWFEIKVTY